MKLTILCLLAICSAFIAQGQELAFSNVSINTAQNRETISFTLSREVNVRYYRLEGSNDTSNFEVVATLPSKGNNMLGRTYSYDLAGLSYKYYRVAMVAMDASMPYSRIVELKGPTPGNPGNPGDHYEKKIQQPAVSNTVVVKN